MELSQLALIAVFVLAFGGISLRIQRTILTAPMLFVAFGILVGGAGLGLIEAELENEVINLVAELTLVLVLFTDASRINLRLLRREHNLPVRMLTIGLPLTIGLGALAGRFLFPAFSGWELLILATILAPTDAALAQAVLASDRVPVRIRQALNVESGLNDGMALPILLFFISAAGASVSPGDTGFWLRFAGLQLTLGPLIGVAVGYFGGYIVQWCTKHEWMSETFQQLSALSLALMAFALAELVGGNGFVAAFAAGLTIGNATRGICNCLYEFAEAEGMLLMLLTFMFYGAVMVAPALNSFDPMFVLYALLSLTVVRMLPVALSLIGTKATIDTTIFLGWFGPRGIASILYGLLLLESPMITHGEEIFFIMVITVLFSVVLHGVTATPGVNRYADRLEAMEADGHEMMEEVPVPEMPIRSMSMMAHHHME